MGVDVLAFGAHPDDVELGCAGVMLRFADAGLATGVVDLTAGERASRGTPQTRAAEAHAATAVLGLAVRETLDFPDTELQPTLELRKAVVAAIRRHRPRVVLAPLPRDLHPDHAAAGRAVADALYPSGMRNFDAPGVPHRPARLFHYFLHDEAAAAVVVDVTEVWDRRMAAARCFASQFHRGAEHDGDSGTASSFPTLIGRSDFFPRLEARARVWGRRAGVTFGEPLACHDSLLISDPLALLAGEPGP